MRIVHVLVINCVIMTTVILLVFSKSGKDSGPRNELEDFEDERNLVKVGGFEEWNTCMAGSLLEINDAEKFRDILPRVIYGCVNKTRLRELEIKGLRNKDEMKYVILPNTKSVDTSNVFVTLGIGKDINAEKAFQSSMSEIGHSVDFYGADPIIDTNSELYSSIGKFFPFAVGSTAGIGNANVLIGSEYVKQNVVHIDVQYFLSKILNIRKIDQFWLDAEGAEFGIFDLYYKDGILERENSFMCQSNMEIHGVNRMEHATQQMDFVKRLIREKQFAILKILSDVHNRMYLVNFGNEYCVRKYIHPDLITS